MSKFFCNIFALFSHLVYERQKNQLIFLRKRGRISMKSKMKRLSSIVLIIAVICSSFALISYANNEFKESGEKLTYIDSYKGDIDHGILTTTVTAKIVGKSTVTSVKIKMELQKLSSGSYSTIETWEQTFYDSYGSMEKSKLTNPISTYRLKVTFTAYSGSNSETKTLYVDE